PASSRAPVPSTSAARRACSRPTSSTSGKPPRILRARRYQSIRPDPAETSITEELHRVQTGSSSPRIGQLGFARDAPSLDSRRSEHLSRSAQCTGDPAGWGILLVDLVRHVAHGYSKD